MSHRIFLLSPARCDGRRAPTLLDDGATLEPEIPGERFPRLAPRAT